MMNIPASLSSSRSRFLTTILKNVYISKSSALAYLIPFATRVPSNTRYAWRGTASRPSFHPCQPSYIKLVPKIKGMFYYFWQQDQLTRCPLYDVWPENIWHHVRCAAKNVSALKKTYKWALDSRSCRRPCRNSDIIFRFRWEDESLWILKSGTPGTEKVVGLSV